MTQKVVSGALNPTESLAQKNNHTQNGGSEKKQWRNRFTVAGALRWRERVAFILLVITLCWFIAGVVEFAVNLFGHHLAFGTAARSISTSVSLIWLVANVVITGFCIFANPRSKHASTITFFSALIVSVVAAWDLFLLVAGFFAGITLSNRVFEIIGGLLQLLVKAGIAVVLWWLYAAVRPVKTRMDEADTTAENQNNESQSKTEIVQVEQVLQGSGIEGQERKNMGTPSLVPLESMVSEETHKGDQKAS